ncbi:MAG: hypothetical protein A2W37_10930 [Chloroflexi bacterium RBG_16_63_12]|jgi:hypothetical protein|nr:hypothetical protein [Anaerolineales bacterium]MBM2848678.1 hypothetical protein [Anaerolineales bacterium]OGO46415.1 MAG: hypothetical protein A2W37_10930 [Chloroflexi bacterium RBG_16_63_12]
MNTRAKDLHKARQSEWERRERQRRMLVIGAWVAAGVLFVGMIVYLVWKQAQPIPRTGEDVPILSSDHIPIGQPHAPYNSNPPTSGPHYEQAAEVGFYDQAPPDEQLVHNLEHGHVIIWYNCGELTESQCSRLKSQIREVMASAGNSLITGTPKLVAVPRTEMETQVALTTWGRLDKFGAFDRQRILNFIKFFRDKAPENNAP